MTVSIDLDQLEAIAREATAGMWEVNEGDDEITLDKNTALTRWNESGTVGYPARSWKTIDRLVEFDPEDLEEDEVDELLNDLQHIAAARPEVVLALIERVRTAEAAPSTLPADDVATAVAWGETYTRLITAITGYDPGNAAANIMMDFDVRPRAMVAPPADDVREALAEFLFTIYEHGTQPNALREADSILAAFEVRPRGTVTEAEESMPVKLLRMFVREHDEGDGPEQVVVEVSDLRHVLRLLDAASEARS